MENVGIFYGHWEPFTALWYILWQFGILHMWSFSIFFPILVWCAKINLATLARLRFQNHICHLSSDVDRLKDFAGLIWGGSGRHEPILGSIWQLFSLIFAILYGWGRCHGHRFWIHCFCVKLAIEIILMTIFKLQYLERQKYPKSQQWPLCEVSLLLKRHISIMIFPGANPTTFKFTATTPAL
jgi:hypothetical protein